MSAIPRARVLRGGEGRRGELKAGVEAAPEGHELRLAPRALPRAVIWRLIWAPLGTLSWLFAAIVMIFLALWLIPGAAGRQASATFISRLFYISFLMTISLGLPVGLFFLPSWIRGLRLLRYGVVAHGTLVQKLEKIEDFSCPLSGMSGTCAIMELTFRYEIGGTTYTVPVRRVSGHSLSRLDLGARVTTLFDPRRPLSETTLDDLSFHRWLEITPSGELQVRSGTALHLLIVPVAFVGQLVATAN